MILLHGVVEKTQAMPPRKRKISSRCMKEHDCHLAQVMKAQSLSNVLMENRMKTSRSRPDRMLDLEHENVTLHAMEHAVAALGMCFKIELRRA